jgi:hypothetical protein
MITGVHGEYQWLEVDHELSKFLEICPQAILGRYLAITAMDSGSFVPSEIERAGGWIDICGVAYSPSIRSSADLPKNSYGRDCCGFDEWYVFDAPPQSLGTICHENVFTTELAPGTVFAFINLFLVLSDPEMAPITEFFWRQMQWIRPESYLGDGRDCLIFSTRNKELFVSAREALRASDPEA